MYNEKSGRLYRDMKQGKHTFAAWSMANPKNSQHAETNCGRNMGVLKYLMAPNYTLYIIYYPLNTIFLAHFADDSKIIIIFAAERRGLDPLSVRIPPSPQ